MSFIVFLDFCKSLQTFINFSFFLHAMPFLIQDKGLETADRVQLLVSYFLQLVLFFMGFVFLFRGEWLSAFLSFGILLLTFLPALLRRSYHVFLPVEFEVFTVILLLQRSFWARCMPTTPNSGGGISSCIRHLQCCWGWWDSSWYTSWTGNGILAFSCRRALWHCFRWLLPSSLAWAGKSLNLAWTASLDYICRNPASSTRWETWSLTCWALWSLPSVVTSLLNMSSSLLSSGISSRKWYGKIQDGSGKGRDGYDCNKRFQFGSSRELVLLLKSKNLRKVYKR